MHICSFGHKYQLTLEDNQMDCIFFCITILLRSKLVYQVSEVQKSLGDIGYDLNELQRLVEGLVS